MYLSQIETPTHSHVEHYPQASQAAIEQMAVFWPAEELGVEADEADFRTKLTEGERYGVLKLQQILTHLERIIGGEEMWGGRIPRLFPRPEIVRMCSVFAMMENNSHAPFYRIGNEVMGNATDEFYNEWQDIPALREHTAFAVKMSKSKDALKATAALTFLEGVVLFTALAFFKGFNSRGYNIIPHFVSGIDGSAKDENFHAQGSAWLFNQCITERIQMNNFDSKAYHKKYAKIIRKLARDTYAHETAIVELIFSHKPETIRIVTKEELLHFARDRVNFVLSLFGLPPMFKQETGTISAWFYLQLNKIKHADFFAATQIQYTRNWAKHKLTFRQDVAREF